MPTAPLYRCIVAQTAPYHFPTISTAAPTVPLYLERNYDEFRGSNSDGWDEIRPGMSSNGMNSVGMRSEGDEFGGMGSERDEFRWMNSEV